MFVIKYTDGAYNILNGHVATFKECSRYETLEEAEIVASSLIDVEGIIDIGYDFDDDNETW